MFLTISAYAQVKPAYSIAEITYINQEAYQKELWPKIQKLVSESGAEIIVADTQGVAVTGVAKAADKVTVIKFKSLQDAKNFYASKGYQEIKPLATKAVKIQLFLVEGR